MTPQFARSHTTERAYSERPTSQGDHYTTIGIIGHDGMKFDHTFQGYLTKKYFMILLKVFIIPMFANTNDYLIMDNCSSHKNQDVINLLKENNVNYLFLSPYSPEYNPIELAWSKVKNCIKKAKPRYELFLKSAIRNAIDSISSQNAIGYFSHVEKFYIVTN
jgi:transposase